MEDIENLLSLLNNIEYILINGEVKFIKNDVCKQNENFKQVDINNDAC